MSELPPWPKPENYSFVVRPDGNGLNMPYVGYEERMKAEFLEAQCKALTARLRIAVEALEDISERAERAANINVKIADETLTDIGQIPP